MNAQFKQAVVIDGQKFPIHQNGAPMVHNVSVKIAKHPHFKHFVKAGLISMTDDPAPTKQESMEERNQRLASKITAQVQKAESDPVEEQPEESVDEHPDDEESMDDDSENDGAAESDDEMGEDFGDEDEPVSDDVELAPKKAKVKTKKKKKRKH